ncbi:putative exopolyphosphatase [Dictyocoela muelleri]|nr:putative exopolyphosphatase [Dictyocoela muelleri]
MSFSSEIKNFLTKNKQKIHSNKIKITIGNESCDLDSFVSSLIAAYCENNIHVVNMNKKTFISKGELMLLLNMFKIDIDDLIFFETEPVPINFRDLQKTENSIKIEKIDDASERKTEIVF